MLRIKPPVNWDAEKFRVRYSLNRDTDYYVDADSFLVVFPALPDDPPIFEQADPPGPTEKQILEQRLASIESRLTTVESKVPVSPA